MLRIKLLLYYLYIFIILIFYRKKIFLLGVPLHGNLGDHAIAFAEEKYLKANFKGYKVINIHTSILIKYSWMFKRYIGKSQLLYTGGGFLGSLWINEEEMFRSVLKLFPNNKIVVLPQTFYFSNDDYGKRVLADSVKLYSNHKNLHLICREKYSYEFMKKNFKKNNIYLAPDMVLYLDQIKEKNSRSKILMCIRNDKEKLHYDFNEIIEKLHINNNDIDYTSTLINKNILPYERKKHIMRKIEEFAKYEFVITDRLHGMIFSYLAGTPCLVFDNKSYKIKGVYDWIKDCKYINYYNNINIITIKQENSLFTFSKEKYDVITKIFMGGDENGEDEKIY